MFTRLILFFVIISFSFVFGQDSKNPNSLYEELGNYVIKNYDNVFLDRPEAIRSVIKSSKDNLVYYGTFNGIIEYDGKNVKLSFTEKEKVFDPDDVYGDAPNPTIL